MNRSDLLRQAWRAFFLAAFCGSMRAANPAIEITNVPSYGSFDNLGGRVLNADPALFRVAVFIYVPNAGWWSKPFCDPQLTVIQPGSSWAADITTGGSDQFATKITALLVSSNYDEPCVLGLAALPTNVTSQAIATATVERPDPSIRRIAFSGYDWWVKTGPGLMGPGPNYFSDSTNNIWVDGRGQLHLRITNFSNQWQCAEIVSGRTFGYGSYRFELNSGVDDLDPSAILGLFTWSDDPAYAHREIDIECSRWSNATDANNAQFVVQPWDVPSHLVRYDVPTRLTNSTHLFTWETNQVHFQSLRGSFVPNPAPANIIRDWMYLLDVPQSGDENVRINLWLNNGNPPAGGAPVECVVKSFQFVPLGMPSPCVITNPAPTAGGFSFAILGQPDRRYEVQTSTNLSDWSTVETVLATNTLTRCAVSSGFTPCFFRAVTLP